MTQIINEDWFDTNTFVAYKKGIPVKFSVADTSGLIETLEGPVVYEVGHRIITVPNGEQHSIPLEKFANLYVDNNDGTATPKRIFKMVKLADHDGELHTPYGDLHYTKDEHFIIRNGINDYDAVEKDIFQQTYGHQIGI